MPHVLTLHAQKRCQQRGVSSGEIELTLRYGVERPVGGGLVHIALDNGACQEIIRDMGDAVRPLLEKARHFYLIVDQGHNVITVAPRIERPRNKPESPGKVLQRERARCARGRPWPR